MGRSQKRQLFPQALELSLHPDITLSPLTLTTPRIFPTSNPCCRHGPLLWHQGVYALSVLKAAHAHGLGEKGDHFLRWDYIKNNLILLNMHKEKLLCRRYYQLHESKKSATADLSLSLLPVCRCCASFQVTGSGIFIRRCHRVRLYLGIWCLVGCKLLLEDIHCVPTHQTHVQLKPAQDGQPSHQKNALNPLEDARVTTVLHGSENRAPGRQIPHSGCKSCHICTKYHKTKRDHGQLLLLSHRAGFSTPTSFSHCPHCRMLVQLQRCQRQRHQALTATLYGSFFFLPIGTAGEHP